MKDELKRIQEDMQYTYIHFSKISQWCKLNDYLDIKHTLDNARSFIERTIHEINKHDITTGREYYVELARRGLFLDK